MSTWNKSTEIWTLKQRLNEIEDPMQIYELMNAVKEKEFGWAVAEALYEGQIQMQVSQKKTGKVNLKVEDGYVGGLENSQKMLKATRTDISDCVKAIEDRFVDAMDHWMYATRDEEHQKSNKSALEAAISDEALKSKTYYQLHKLISYMPDMLKAYKNILAIRNEKTPKAQDLESISQDAVSMYHELNDWIFLADADKAYA